MKLKSMKWFLENANLKGQRKLMDLRGELQRVNQELSQVQTCLRSLNRNEYPVGLCDLLMQLGVSPTAVTPEAADAWEEELKILQDGSS